jgi:hypothetical protein
MVMERVREYRRKREREAQLDRCSGRSEEGKEERYDDYDLVVEDIAWGRVRILLSVAIIALANATKTRKRIKLIIPT